MTYLEDMAYANDRRVTAIEERWWSNLRGNEALYERETEDGTETLWVRVEFVVCSLCEGRGRHVNPSIDAQGLTASDFDEDPDFRERYLGGDYDINCNLCQGDRVVPVPLDPALLAEVQESVRERAYWGHIENMERMVGA